jgi:hypothetical protein
VTVISDVCVMSHSAGVQTLDKLIAEFIYNTMFTEFVRSAKSDWYFFAGIAILY